MQRKLKDASRFVGKSIAIEGKGVNDEKYSQEKTAFYKELIQMGMMKDLMPVSKDKKGYAIIIPKENGIRYFAGVLSDENLTGYEKLEMDSQEYLVLDAKNGVSRLLFDQLQNVFFTDKERAAQYNKKEILEVLINGNPMDAEVELWVPVKQR